MCYIQAFFVNPYQYLKRFAFGTRLQTGEWSKRLCLKRSFMYFTKEAGCEFLDIKLYIMEPMALNTPDYNYVLHAASKSDKWFTTIHIIVTSGLTASFPWKGKGPKAFSPSSPNEEIVSFYWSISRTPITALYGGIRRNRLRGLCFQQTTVEWSQPISSTIIPIKSWLKLIDEKSVKFL